MVYAGTPEFAVPALRQIIDAGHQIVGVYSQPDRPAGRGRQLTASPVKQCAVAHDLAVFQPEHFKDPASVAELQALQPDVVVVAAYGLLLPAAVLEIPALGCLNIHASLLPRWRGAAPLQRAMLAGDKTTGVTIMLMDEGLDTGAMLGTDSVDITPQMICAELHDELSQLGGETLLKLLPKWCRGEIEAQAQPQTDNVTYAAKLTKSEARIDWAQPALMCHRKIMAFNPWPVAETLYDGKRLRLWRSRLQVADLRQNSEEAAVPGQVIKASGDELWVQTGEGVLALESVQMPGKKAMPVSEFMNSRELDACVFGSSSTIDGEH